MNMATIIGLIQAYRVTPTGSPEAQRALDAACRAIELLVLESMEATHVMWIDATDPQKQPQLEPSLVRASVTTHDPSKYTLHNSEDGTVWQMTAEGSWTRKRNAPPT